MPVEAIQKVGSTFTGVEHRIEPVRVLDGVTYYNDSIGTSPTRTIAGLRSFDQKVILIAGGYDKHIPYEPLAPEVIAHVKNLVLMGATGPRIEKAVCEHPDFAASGLTIQHADTMQHAVELARRRTARRYHHPVSGQRILRPVPQLRGARPRVQEDRQRAEMIRQATTPRAKLRFYNACRGKLCLGATMPLALELLGKSQPGRFFAGPTLALDIGGSTAWMAGHANPKSWPDS